MLRFFKELVAESVPFHDLRLDPQVILAVVSGKRPERPSASHVEDKIWNLCELCWSGDPSSRPSICQVAAILNAHMPDPPTASRQTTNQLVRYAHTTHAHPAPRLPRRRALIISILYKNQVQTQDGETFFTSIPGGHDTAALFQNLLESKMLIACCHRI
jgi:hypothetical protein